MTGGMRNGQRGRTQSQAPAAHSQSAHEHVADPQAGMMISLGSERIFLR